MTELLLSVAQSDISEALVLLALEDADPARALLQAPPLEAVDRDGLRRWYGTLEDVRLAPFSAGYAAQLRALLKGWPEPVGRSVLDWAAGLAGLHDPNAERDDWPGDAFDAWWMALKVARGDGLLDYFDAPSADRTRLETLIRERDAALAQAEAGTAAFGPLWDPWDADRIAYNRRFRTAFDLWFYDHVFIPGSFHLGEAVVRMADHQSARRFIAAYATLPEALRQQVAEALPQLVTGVGPYGHHPWQTDRLMAYRDSPPDRLAHLAALPDLWGFLMSGQG